MSWTRPAILGGVDGVITSFAVIASCHAAEFDTYTAFVIGLSSLLADGTSMGISEYLSTRTNNSNTRLTIARLEKGVEREQKQMLTQQLSNKLETELAMTRENARKVAKFAADYPKVFSKLYGNNRETSTPAWALGVVCAFSFVLCGVMPLVVYSLNGGLPSSILTSLMVLFVLGVIKEPQNKIVSIVEIGILGALAGSLAYAFANFVSQI